MYAVLSLGSTLCLLCLEVKYFDDSYFSVCGNVKKLLRAGCRRDVLVIIHVDEAMHRSLVDLELTLNLGLSQMIVVK